MKWGKHTYYVYVLQHPYRDKLRAKLADAGIGTGIHYNKPIHLAPAYKQYTKSLPITEKLSKDVFSIPIYPHLKDAQVEYIVKKLKELQ